MGGGNGASPLKPGLDEEGRPQGALHDMEKAEATHGCQRKACAIQECLARHDYNQSRCQRVIQDMRDCCRALAEPSLHCKGFGQ
ncbi:hypothetical protein HYH03_004036 [Edaphochlamys debaryana]|uniref:Cx9C motif-containing protein 4, mitochondrial n=1 Tax=Edaphochlamys debaryana TaxID=47281 RepID=A0A835YHJ6_9CHLO|nr:hypothetical protein HYH03_004036 [Edaphochlamys debaryana]|eukprot:KAG2497764.1 hypothetical protein HYH03_004036 [Edaphochlamys debaryana]